MQPIQSITIPQPCQENWNNMTPVDQGRHCAACRKTVTDFTAMSNLQITKYLAQHGKLCGRFGNSQLDNLNSYISLNEAPLFSWKKLALAAALTSLFTTVKAQAPIILGKVAVSQSVGSVKNSTVKDSISYVTLKGKVISGDDKLPVVGASVAVKNKAVGAMTDVNGNFKLRVPFENAQTLVINLIGYQRLEVSASMFLNEQTAALQMAPALMGEIAIVKRPGMVKRCWHKLKRAF